MKLPLISVMVPVYNVEPYLKECLDSIISQDYVNIEILLVNDGSSDKSGDICDAFSKKDKRIKVIHNPNYGVAKTRNILIDNALGEYLVFVDSDDILAKNHISVLYCLIQKYDCKISVGVLKTFKSFPNTKEWHNYEEFCMEPQEAVKQMNYQRKFDTWPVCKLYHKSLFDNGLRYTDGKIFEDLILTWQILLQSDKVAYCNKVIYYYRLWGNSIEGAKFSNKKMDGALEVINTFKNNNDILRPIYKSYQCRMVCFACHLLLKMPKDYPQKQVIKDLLYDNRRAVLFDREARIKARFASLASYLGLSTLKAFFWFVDRRK